MGGKISENIKRGCSTTVAPASRCPGRACWQVQSLAGTREAMVSESALVHPGG